MAAKRRAGERGRWRAVLLIEAIKAICRLLLLRITQQRPLVEPPLPEREDVDPSLLEKAASDMPDLETFSVSDEDAVAENEPEYTKPYPMPRTSLLLPPLPATPTAASLTHYLLTHVLTPTDILPPPSLLARLSSFPAYSAEVLHIMRPLIYALALAHYSQKAGKNGKRDWRPWLLGVGLELLARQVARRERAGDTAWGRGIGMTGLEKEEIRRRGWGMTWWAVRGACYENVTRNWLESVTGRLKGKFAVDLLGGILEDYGHLWGDYYFSTATM
jgi:peroxin-16